MRLAIQSSHFDYNSEYLETLLKQDNRFIIKFIDFLYSGIQRIDIGRVDIDFDVIWRNISFDEIVKAIRLIASYDEGNVFYYSSLLRVLFKTNSDAINTIQLNFIIDIIINQNLDEQLMVLLFEIAMDKNDVFKLKVIKCFLQNNTDIEKFKKLSIESRLESWSGSAVPLYQRKIDYFVEMLGYCDNINLLDHREYIQNQIDVNESYKEHEKKSDFRGRW